ncbi:TERF1-interacting nuclear factor 2 [Halichoeres trimaculatus]|uniref:TERF1-interacting nuclear factor 2 n=1 Tax=Halichoeres trimaculatus TaxID=147232 RepID=UPI003D9ECFA3
MATIKPKDKDASLPFAALQLLAPPVRLVSAALWKVMKQRDVMQYGVVEEFVTSACETVPGLLTVRHQGKLALGLRGRYILELLSSKPDENVIKANLERIRAPAALSLSSASVQKRDVKILRTIESFHSLVHMLLTDAAERAQFFKEEFPAEYGPEFDQELEKLLWEFLIRVDQLLPVPNLAQTVAWLSDAPPVLEECARAATQPQLLKVLLHHQTCLGHLETAASLPPNMGDSILNSLSLPPSGKVPSNQPTGAKTTRGDKTPFISPVIGLISNEEVPVMASTSKRTLRNEERAEFTSVKERKSSERSSGMKRKRPGGSQSESDEEEEVLSRSGRKGMSGSSRSEARMLKKCRGDEKEEDEADELPQLSEDSSLPQPRVVIEKLPAASLYPHMSRRGGKSSTGKTARNQPHNADLDCPGLDNKENHPRTSPSSSSSQSQTPSETAASSGGAEEYVADSEDEATKNFKSRLFMKCYYKTKHGTYVPTLREFRKPWMTQRPSASTLGKRR